jgi:dual specificity phosphatase 12
MQVSQGIFVSGWEFAYDLAALKRYNISHILVVANAMKPAFPGQFKYKVRSIVDSDEQDVLGHFAPCCGFIERARKNGGAVLIHCHAGQSRSVTFAAAYMMAKHRMSAQRAVEEIKARIAGAEPNNGFLRQLGQLEIRLKIRASEYEERQKQDDQDDDDDFSDSESAESDGERAVAASSMSTETQTARTETETETKAVALPQYKCKACRLPLFDASALVEHSMQESHSRHYRSKRRDEKGTLNCSSYFVERLPWMDSEPMNGLEDVCGKLLCPNAKCGARIGSWKWDGAQCSCGAWLTPALQIIKARVDQPMKRPSIITVAPPIFQ